MSRLSQLEELFANDPNDPFLHFAIAKEYEGSEQWQEALDRYNTLRDKFPEYVGLYYHLAQLLQEMGQKEKALEVYDAGILVAKKATDFHALSELNNARLNCELE